MKLTDRMYDNLFTVCGIVHIRFNLKKPPVVKNCKITKKVVGNRIGDIYSYPVYYLLLDGSPRKRGKNKTIHINGLCTCMLNQIFGSSFFFVYTMNEI